MNIREIRLALFITVQIFAFTGNASLATALRCQNIAFNGHVYAGHRFLKQIGGRLVLVLSPYGMPDPIDESVQYSGWHIALNPVFASGSPDVAQDFIYPVNPPIRFNPWQDIGPSYGVTAEQKLKNPIDYNFVLSEPDFLKIDGLVTDALWPYSAKDPDHADERYLEALEVAQLGQIRFTAIRRVATPQGKSIQFLAFRIQINAPSTFAFSHALNPQPSACPVRKN